MIHVKFRKKQNKKKKTTYASVTYVPASHVDLPSGEKMLTRNSNELNQNKKTGARDPVWLAFSSRLWHASGRNHTRRARRVFYAQFSSRPLTDGSKDPNPISLAVPCGH